MQGALECRGPPTRPPRPSGPGPPQLTPSRHTLSSLSAMAREPGVRARRRPKLRRDRPGPAPASPGAAASPPSPGRALRAAVRPPPPPVWPTRHLSRGVTSTARTPTRPPGRYSRRHLGTPAGSPDLPAHFGSHLLREGGAAGSQLTGGWAEHQGAEPQRRSTLKLRLSPIFSKEWAGWGGT